MIMKDGTKSNIRFPSGKHCTQVHGNTKHNRRTSKQETKLKIEENYEELEEPKQKKGQEIDLYFQLYEILRNYSLHIEIYGDSFILQNQNELVDVKRSDEEKLRISYLTLDKEIAQKTISSCPEVIKGWRVELSSLMEIKDYQPIPYFSAILDFKDALTISSYLCDKMISNDYNLKKLVLH